VELLQQNSVFISIHIGFTKTVQLELHNSIIYDRAAIAEPLITEIMLKVEKYGMMIIKPGHLIRNTYCGYMSHPSCSQQ
jgi:hypothetical protein